MDFVDAIEKAREWESKNLTPRHHRFFVYHDELIECFQCGHVWHPAQPRVDEDCPKCELRIARSLLMASPRPSLLRGFIWVRYTDASTTPPGTWLLKRPRWKERSAGTVYANGTWWTWDENGIGGENASDETIEIAMREVEKALIRQKWHGAEARRR